MPNFNTQLRALRQEAGLSQQEFANRMGLSKSSINMYERGEREPSLDTLDRIASFFGCDIDYLLGKSDIKKKPTMTVKRKVTAVLAQNIIHYRKTRSLTQEQFSTLLGVDIKTAQEIEKGSYTFDHDMILRICKVLRVTPEHLDGTISESTDEVLKVALFGGDTEVTDEMWHEVMNYAEFLKQKYGKT